MSPSADPSNTDSDNQNVHTIDEQTPLLGVPDTSGDPRREIDAVHSATNGHIKQPNGHLAGDETTQERSQNEDDDRPLPVKQIILLCFTALQDPIAYFSIFPFVNEMIERTGDINPKDVGFWSGAIESVFSVVQMLMMLVYGRMADRIGRKPVLVFSLVGVSVASALFGMSRTLWQMILFRSCAGLFSGSVVNIRTMISENSTKKTQARAFSWYMFSRNLGILIGPIIGGGLSDLAEQYPKRFGNSTFIRDYPYAMAGFASCAVGFLMAVVTAVGLKETLQKKASGSDSAAANKPMSTWEVIKAPGVAITLVIYNHIMLVSLCYTAVSTVYMYTPIHLGGLSFKPMQITIFLALAGSSQAAWMLVAFPLLQPRFGTGVVLRACCYVAVFFVAIWPMLNELLRAHHTTAFWIIGVSNLTLGSGIAMSFACVQLCLNDISPSPTVNATLNALALAITSGIRAFMPAVFTSIFAFGVKWGGIHGHLVWVFLIILEIVACVLLQWLPEKAAGKPTKKVLEQDEEHDD